MISTIVKLTNNSINDWCQPLGCLLTVISNKYLYSSFDSSVYKPCDFAQVI